MKKIRSGQPFLYRSKGLNSTVFEVRVKFEVSEVQLNSALQLAISRYPYFKTLLIEDDGEFGQLFNPLPIQAVQSKDLRPLGGKEVNYHLLDVTCNNQSIFISFHHSLCDGKGIMPFIRTLLYYLISYKMGNTFKPNNIRLARTPLLPGETDDPISGEMHQVDLENLPNIISKGFFLPESHNESEAFYRHEFRFPINEFINRFKSNSATPSIYLALSASKAIDKLYPDHNEPIVCSLASDLRNEIGFTNTYKNCVGSIYLPYNSELSELSDKEKSLRYREIIKEQKDVNVVKNSLNSQIGLALKLEQFKGFKAKQQVMDIFNNLVIDSFILSYPGQLDLGEYENYIESMHLYSSGNRGLIINGTSAGDYFTIEVLQSFKSTTFIEELKSVFKSDGLSYLYVNHNNFETPIDRIQESLGLNKDFKVSETRVTA